MIKKTIGFIVLLIFIACAASLLGSAENHIDQIENEELLQAVQELIDQNNEEIILRIEALEKSNSISDEDWCIIINSIRRDLQEQIHANEQTIENVLEIIYEE